MTTNNVVIEQRVSSAQFLSHVFMVLMALSLALTVLLSFTLFQMSEKLEVVPQLIGSSVGDSDEFFYSTKLDTDSAQLAVLEQAFARHYIEERFFRIPNLKEMKRRWGANGDAVMMSGYDKARKQRIFPPVARNSDKRLENADIMPTQHAENIKYISRVGHSWVFEFDVVSATDGIVENREKKQANITISYLPERRNTVYHEGNLFNPFGMTITRWEVTDVMI